MFQYFFDFFSAKSFPHLHQIWTCFDEVSIIRHWGGDMATTSPCPFQHLFLQLLDGLLKFLVSTSTMQPRDEMVRTGQVLLEANACHEQQNAEILPMLKVTFSAILKIGIYRIYETAPCFPSNLSRQCPQVLRFSPLTSEICPVWRWKNKLHHQRHPPICVRFQRDSTTAVLSSLTWSQFVWRETSCWRCAHFVKNDVRRDPENWGFPYTIAESNLSWVVLNRCKFVQLMLKTWKAIWHCVPSTFWDMLDDYLWTLLFTFLHPHLHPTWWPDVVDCATSRPVMFWWRSKDPNNSREDKVWSTWNPKDPNQIGALSGSAITFPVV